MFTDNILIGKWEGKRALMFRTANSRTTHIMDAQARLYVVKRKVTAKGGNSVMVSLDLVRDAFPSFVK